MAEFTERMDQNGIVKYYRDGVELEKGVQLTKERIEQHRQLYEKYCNFFSAYPDLYVDLISRSEDTFTLFFYQRIFLRACLRFKQVYIIAPRAFSKTFISILAIILQCIFIPKTKRFICAPKKEQSGKIAKEKFDEIFDRFPMLRKEVLSYTTSNDNVKLVFRNGSVFDVVAALDSARGGRRTGGLIDEVRDHDANQIVEVVLPLMNVKRRNSRGLVNNFEPQPQQLWMSSAGTKSSYCYAKLIELLENEIIDPQSTFVMGMDYRVPMMHGLIDKQYINSMKMSQTVNDDSFAREYLGRFTGNAEDSWFDFNKLTKYRKLLNPELSQNLRGHTNCFYFISCDVARTETSHSCQTVAIIFKVYENDGRYDIRVVNIIVVGAGQENRNFRYQAQELKRLIDAYKPREVLIDTNGLGVGLMDEMVFETPCGDITYPGYHSVNNDDYSQRKYPGSIPLIYNLKSNGTLDSQIHAAAYAMLNSGKVIFLTREQEAKNKLLATQAGQKMTLEKRARRLMPHELTTRLFEELTNLRLKQTGSNDVRLERINTNMGKDKWSALEYGLYRLKQMEDDYILKTKKNKRGKRKLAFFTAGR